VRFPLGKRELIYLPYLPRQIKIYITKNARDELKMNEIMASPNSHCKNVENRNSFLSSNLPLKDPMKVKIYHHKLFVSSDLPLDHYEK